MYTYPRSLPLNRKPSSILYAAPEVPREMKLCSSHLFSYILLGTDNSFFKEPQLLRNWGQSLSQAEPTLGSLEIKEQASLGTEVGPGGLSGRKQRAPGQGGCSGNPLHRASSSQIYLEAKAGNKSLDGAGRSMGHPAERLLQRPHLHKIMKPQ